MSDSFNAFKLHHPNYSTLHNNNSAPPKIIPFCICSHCTNLISFNHHHHHLGDDEGGSSRRRGLLHGQSQSESQHQSSSSRWSPTPAQLLVLEELYRQGTKTPTAEQIQQIASQLRRFGKIEGKNVFYWFQNHKARERQKRRRREMEEDAHHHHHPHSDDSPQDKQHPPETGLRGTGYEVKETKKWASSSNCSGLAEQEPVSSLLEIAESGPNNNGWSNKVQGTQVLKGITISSNNYNSQTKSSHNNSLNTETCTYCDDEEEEDDDDDEEEYANSRRTLELFPLKRDHQDGIFLKQRKSRFYASTNYSLGSEITSRQFFEFLPLKD